MSTWPNQRPGHDSPDAPPEPAPPAPEPAAVDEHAPAAPAFGWDDALGLLVHGVPLVTFDNPYGGIGLGILAGIDLDATHESGQKRAITGTFPPEYEPIPKSGGAAWYADSVTGKTWTVALNPDTEALAGGGA